MSPWWRVYVTPAERAAQVLLGVIGAVGGPPRQPGIAHLPGPWAACRPRSEPARGQRLRKKILLICVLALGGALSALPAWAHGEGESEEGYLLVQQALGHLAHATTIDGVTLAMEKIDDALGTEDQEGVDVAELRQAKAALEAGQTEQGRALLQHSISEAVSQLEPATGEETGTTVVLDPLPRRGSLTGADWGVLATSVALVLLGGGLAWHFGPVDSVSQLRGIWGSHGRPWRGRWPRMGRRKPGDLLDGRRFAALLHRFFVVPRHDRNTRASVWR